MKKIIFALLLCLLATNVFCEEYDGRWWNSLQSVSKLLYIVGFSEAYTQHISIDENKFPYKYTYGEIRDFVDKFYSNPQYKVFYVRKILSYIIFPALKEAWSQEDIDKKALRILKELNEGKQQ